MATQEQALNQIIAFGTLLLTDASGSSYPEPSLILDDFTPSQINLSNMPSVDGTFIVSSLSGGNPFASGTYELTNVVINDDDLIDEIFTWNVTNPNLQCNLTIVDIQIKDTTTSDYYYTYADYYTPLSKYPNPELSDSNSVVTVQYPTLYRGINYFATITNNSTTSKSALFFIKIGAIPDVCILNDQYINDIKIPAGISLRFLLAIAVSERSSAMKNQILYLEYIYNLANTSYTSISPQNQGAIPLFGYPFPTTMNGIDVACGLFPAVHINGAQQKRGSAIIGLDGYVDVLLVINAPTQSGEQFSQNLIPSTA